MDRDEQDFDLWLAGHEADFDTAIREGVDGAAVLRAIKDRSAKEAQNEITNRVLVAAVTGRPPEPEPKWPAERWERVDADFARLASEPTFQQCKRSWSVRCDQAPMPVEVTPGLARTFDCSLLFAEVPFGQRGALDRIVALVRPLAYRYVRAEFSIQGAPMRTADDLAHQALLSMFKALPSYADRQGQPFLEFAYHTIRRVVRTDHTRSLWIAHPRLWTQAHAPSPTAVQGEPSSTLLRTLASDQREVVVLRIIVGLSPEEIATALGKDAGWVNHQQKDAMAALRKLVRDAIEPPHPK